MADGPLQVPEQHRSALVDLAGLEGTDLDSLCTALSPSGWRGTQAELVVSAREAGFADGAAWVEALTSLSSLRVNADAESDAVAARVIDALGLTTSSVGLARLIDLASIEQLAKTFDLSYSYERVLHSARLLSEVRPVFKRDVKEPPTAVVLTYQLELSYYFQDGLKVEYFALDENDLRQLARVVQRATDKSVGLRSMLERSGTGIIEWERDTL